MVLFFMSYLSVSLRKMAQKLGNFNYFLNFENLSICLANIAVTKFHDHFFHIFLLIVKKYFVFGISNCIWWKNGLESAVFHNFMVFENLSTCLAKFSVIKFSNHFFMLIIIKHFLFAISNCIW